MNLFYSPPETIHGSTIMITGQEALHIFKVLRHQIGDEISVTDGEGNLFEGTISEIDKRSVEVKINHKKSEPPSLPKVTLAIGLIKKRDRLEFAVEKAVELGATKIALYRADHSEKGKVRMDRVEATVTSAMKQSKRLFMPDVILKESLDDLLSDKGKQTTVVIADQSAKNHSVDLDPGCREVLLVVGPEGGYSSREEEVWKKYDVKTVLLGDKRLRAETAAIVMVDRFCSKRIE